MALRVGIIGMRGIGMNHVNAHKEDPLSDLRAVCDVVKERADSAAEKHGVRAYYSLAEMLRNEELDVVDVTTGGYENGSWHYEPAMEALEANKHVLVEKPLSNDVNEARQMVAKAAEKGLYLGCNLNHYFTPPAEKARQYMDEGKIGELVYCLHKMGFSSGEPTYNPGKSSRWWGFPYAHLKAFLSHPFSVMRYFCGDVTHIQAFVERPGFRRRVSDVIRLVPGASNVYPEQLTSGQYLNIAVDRPAAARYGIGVGDIQQVIVGNFCPVFRHRDLPRPSNVCCEPRADFGASVSTAWLGGYGSGIWRSRQIFRAKKSLISR